MQDLRALADLLKEKHLIDEKIANLVGRPAQIGHVGEYIASVVFDIRLEHSAVNRAHDGRFTRGSLAGRSVNIKWYGLEEGALDIHVTHQPDDYLVLTGPRSVAPSSRGAHRPWIIASVFLFDAQEIIGALVKRGNKLGAAASVARQHWETAEIYPVQRNSRLMLTDQQRATLALFG